MLTSAFLGMFAGMGAATIVDAIYTVRGGGLAGTEAFIVAMAAGAAGGVVSEFLSLARDRAREHAAAAAEATAREGGASR